jgi:hypothetical protein
MEETESSDFDHRLEIYEKLVKSIPEVERKGKTVPYTSINGNMFTYLDKNGNIAIRLDKENIEDIIKKYGASMMISYGIVQKEYIKIPDTLFKKKKILEGYFAKSYEYAKSLKPKPTKQKKNK